MKLATMSFIRTFILILTPFVLFAQEDKDYSILLNSGKFTPAENIITLNKDASIFRNSSFGNKHYVTLQFRAIPSDAMKAQMKSAGIELIDYIPNLAYTASISTNFDIASLRSFPLRSMFQFTPAQKTVPALLNGTVPPYAIKNTGYVDLTIITYEKLSAEQVRPVLRALDASIIEDMPMFRSFVIRVPRGSISQIPALSFVQWVEFIDPPNERENLLGRSLHRVNTLNDGVRNLKGDGIKIGIWDENEVSPHLDFSPMGRVSIMEPTGTASSHSTHCAGTITGRGIIDPRARGMAPNASLFSHNFNGNIPTEMANAIPNLGLNVSSHSYGSTQTCGLSGAGVTYSATSRATDLNLNAFPSHLHVHSSGNSQTSCTGGWSTITASGKSAKNNILVANISSAEALNGTSSCGPVQDGRVKPEISSFGTSVLSTYTPLNAYGTISGTSMATPGVAGSVALLVERYRQLNAGSDRSGVLLFEYRGVP